MGKYNENFMSIVASIRQKREMLVKIILVVSIFTGIFFRFFRLGLQELWYDELFSTVSAMEPRLSGLFSNWIYCDGNPPLYSLFLWCWLKIFPATEFFVRLPSAIASSLSLIFMYFLGKKVFHKDIAIVVTVLFAFSYGGLYFAQEARSYSLLILFSLFAFYYWMNVIQNFTSKKLFLRYLAAFTISIILLSYLHYFGILLGGILLVYLFLLAFQQKTNLKWLFICSALWLLFYIPWLDNLLFLLKIDKSLWSYGDYKVMLGYAYHLFFANNILSRIITVVFVVGGIMIFILSFVKIFQKKRYKETLSLNKNALVYVSVFSALLIFLMPLFLKGITYKHFVVFFPLHYFHLAIAYSKLKMPRLLLLSLVFAISALAFIYQIGNYYKVHKQQWGTSVKHVLNNYNASMEVVILGEPQRMPVKEYIKRGLVYESFYVRNLYFYQYYFNRFNKKQLPIKLKVVRPELEEFKLYIKEFQETGLNEFFILGGHHLKLDEKTLDFLEMQTLDNYEENFFSTKLYWFKLY